MVQSLVRITPSRSSLLRLGAAVLAFAFCVHAAPQRIVSTFPSVTETLFALGAGDRVVGVSNYCRYPPAALALPKVGSFSKPDAEKIALLRPDLVVIEKSAGGLGERLSALCIRQLEVTLGSLPDIYTMISVFGASSGVVEPAALMNGEILARLETSRSKPGTRPSVLIVVGRAPGQLTGLVVAGRGAYLSELLEIAGGRNAMAETPVTYPHISFETVERMNPDAIVDLSTMGMATTIRQRRIVPARHGSSAAN